MPGGTICSIANCKSNSKRAKQEDQVIRFFTFPNEPSLKEDWVKACRQKDNFDPKFKRICSLHFNKSDFEDELQAQIMNFFPKKLKKEAVPTVNLPSSSENSTSTSPVKSPVKKKTSAKLRKELVEECLKQYNEIQVKNTTNKGKEKVSYLNTREITTGPKKRKKLIMKLKKQKTEENSEKSKDDKLISSFITVKPKAEKRQTYTEKMKRLLGESNYELHKEKEKLFESSTKDKSSRSKKRKRPPVKLKKLIDISSDDDDDNFSDIISSEVIRSSLPQKKTGYSDKLRKRKNNDVSYIDAIDPDEVSTYSTTHTTETIRCSNKNCQRQLKALDEENDSLRKVIIGHMQNKADLEHKITLMQKEMDSDSRFEEKAKECFKGFLSANQVNVALNKKTKTWWTQEDMSRAFSILYFSKQCYLHLRNTLHYPLPGLSTLQKWTLSMGKACSAENALNQANEAANQNSEANAANESLNLENQPLNDFNFAQCNSSDHPTNLENLSAGIGNNGGNFNLVDGQVNNFHPTQNIPTGSEILSNQEGQLNGNLKPGESQPGTEATENLPNDSENQPPKGKNSKKVKPPRKRQPPIATKKFEFQSYLKNYLNKKNQNSAPQGSTGKEKPYTCSICRHGFDKNIALQRHYKIHISEDPWKCDVCDEVFITKFYLEKHILTHKGDNNKFVCDICSRSFLKKNSFKDHYLLHKNLKPLDTSKESPKKGEQCTVMYPNGNAPAGDKSASNNSMTLTRYSSPKDQPFSCHVCNEFFDDKSSLKAHLPIHGKRIKKVFQKLYTCATCSKEFKFHHYFKKHLQTCTEKKIFACEVCDKTFAHPGSVTRHMLLHDQQTWFYCEICNKGFKQRYYLKQHMIVHSGEKPFACTWCEKRFAQNSTLKKHIEAHKSGNYPNQANHAKKKQQVEIPSTSSYPHPHPPPPPPTNYPINPNPKRNPMEMPSCASFPNTNYPLDPNLKRNPMEMPSSSYYYLTQL